MSGRESRPIESSTAIHAESAEILPVIHIAGTQHIGGHKSYKNESLTGENESPLMGHALLLRARPEEFQAGNKFPDFAGFAVVRPGMRDELRDLVLHAHEG